MAIIGISGKIGSGKDTVGKIIQYLTVKERYKLDYSFDKFIAYSESEWEIKKFAYKLKQIVSLLTGIPVEDLEKQEVKDRVLGEEWQNAFKGYSGAMMNGAEYADLVHKQNRPALTVRALLQIVGTDAMRDVIHPNIWVNALFADYKLQIGKYDNVAIQDSYPNWIITDVRFPNEADAILARGGVMLRVNRGKINPCSAHDQHISETALDSYSKFNYTISNDGTIEELVPKIKDVLQKLNLIKQ